ncbi:hypothetical protein HK097_005489, partial [Rhizophlyctis rosea]
MSPVTTLPPPLGDESWGVVGSASKRGSGDWSRKGGYGSIESLGSTPRLTNTTGSAAGSGSTTPNGSYLPPTLDTLAVLDDTLKKLERFTVENGSGESPVLSGRE